MSSFKTNFIVRQIGHKTTETSTTSTCRLISRRTIKMHFYVYFYRFTGVWCFPLQEIRKQFKTCILFFLSDSPSPLHSSDRHVSQKKTSYEHIHNPHKRFSTFLFYPRAGRKRFTHSLNFKNYFPWSNFKRTTEVEWLLQNRNSPENRRRF